MKVQKVSKINFFVMARTTNYFILEEICLPWRAFRFKWFYVIFSSKRTDEIADSRFDNTMTQKGSLTQFYMTMCFHVFGRGVVRGKDICMWWGTSRYLSPWGGGGEFFWLGAGDHMVFRETEWGLVGANRVKWEDHRQSIANKKKGGEGVIVILQSLRFSFFFS